VENSLDGKQNTLTAGDNITIDGKNVISSSGGDETTPSQVDVVRVNVSDRVAITNTEPTLYFKDKIIGQEQFGKLDASRLTVGSLFTDRCQSSRIRLRYDHPYKITCNQISDSNLYFLARCIGASSPAGAVIKNWFLQSDTYGAYRIGTYTVPIAGTYSICCDAGLANRPSHLCC